MLPAPRQKLPEISPIFKADSVRLHVFAGKGQGNCTWSMPDGTIRRSFSRTAAGKLAGGWEGETYPPQGSDDPSQFIRIDRAFCVELPSVATDELAGGRQ